MYKYIKKDVKQNHSKDCDKSTGIPVYMKHYIESQTGLSYDDVKIHYSSNQPDQFDALGYTQGNNVYLKQGQEKHLMHELCHVAQQKKGLVKPTSLIGECAINDNLELEKEAELCEAQYKREVPIQMLRKATAHGSKTMGKKGLQGRSFNYHTSAFYALEGCKGDVVWSNHEHWMRKGEGDHAEDAICDCMEVFDWGNVNLRGRKLYIYLSASPCKRCQERLNELVRNYGLKVCVICAKTYRGRKGGGAGEEDDRKYDQKVLEGLNSKELLQFKK